MPNGDYTGKLNEQLSFASGQVSKTVTLSITNDTTPESNETYGLIVQRNSSDLPSTYLVKSLFTIIDNDTAPSETPTATPPSTGSTIAIQSNRDGNPDIYSMNLDGTGLFRLTTIVATNIAPS